MHALGPPSTSRSYVTSTQPRDPRSMHHFHQSTHLETKPSLLFVFQTSSFFFSFFCGFCGLYICSTFHRFTRLHGSPTPFQTTVFGYTSGIKNKRTLSCERGNSILRTESKQGKSASPQSISCSETNGNFVWVSRNANPIPYTQGVGIISGVMLPSCDAFRVIDLAL
jgi:hypothetical protein